MAKTRVTLKDILAQLKNKAGAFKGRLHPAYAEIDQSGGGWTVPSGCGYAVLNAATSQGSLTLPTDGTSGDILYVRNDDDAATTSVAIAAGKVACFHHNGTAWSEVWEQS